ncbi:hypothetical protein EJB05_49997, partial [Eragrostis curvula]
MEMAVLFLVRCVVHGGSLVLPILTRRARLPQASAARGGVTASAGVLMSAQGRRLWAYGSSTHGPVEVTLVVPFFSSISFSSSACQGAFAMSLTAIRGVVSSLSIALYRALFSKKFEKMPTKDITSVLLSDGQASATDLCFGGDSARLKGYILDGEQTDIEHCEESLTCFCRRHARKVISLMGSSQATIYVMI